MGGLEVSLEEGLFAPKPEDGQRYWGNGEGINMAEAVGSRNCQESLRSSSFSLSKYWSLEQAVSQQQEVGNTKSHQKRWIWIGRGYLHLVIFLIIAALWEEYSKVAQFMWRFLGKKIAPVQLKKFFKSNNIFRNSKTDTGKLCGKRVFGIKFLV